MGQKEKNDMECETEFREPYRNSRLANVRRTYELVERGVESERINEPILLFA